MENMSFIQRVVNLFFTPSKAFDGFEEAVSYKDWLYPLIIVSLVLMILPYTFMDISLNEADQMRIKSERNILDNPDFPEERLEEAKEKFADWERKIDDARENPFAWRNMWMKLLIPPMYFLMTAFFSAILLLIGNFGMGGKVRFFQIFAVVMTSYLIGGNGFFMNMLPGVGSIELMVKSPMIIMREASDIALSPGLLFDKIDSFPKQFLNQLDLFRIWGMVVMGFGFAKLYNKSTATGIVAVALPWLTLVAVGAALIQANSRMTG